MDQFLTLQHIYIYAVESKLGPKIAFFWVKTWSNFSLFFFVFQKYSSFCRENEIKKKKKRAKKKTKKTHFFWVKSWSNFVAQHTWTTFWLNLGLSFDSTFLLIFGYFDLFEKMLKPLFYSAFSQKVKFLSPPQKLNNTICEHNCANWFFFVRFFFFFCIFAFWGFCCVRFFGGSFFERNEKRQNSKQNNKKERWPQDANNKTT